IANTAPVAYGALGTPIITLAKVSGLDEHMLSAMAGRQLPFFSLLVPFWVVWAFAGFRGMRGVWPAALTAGLAFAVPQFLVSNFNGPRLVDIVSGACSIAAVVLLLRVWKPREARDLAAVTTIREVSAEATRADSKRTKNGARTALSACSGEQTDNDADKAVRAPFLNPAGETPTLPGSVFRAWLPWIILTVFIFAWGLPSMKGKLDAAFSPKIRMPYLHSVVQR